MRLWTRAGDDLRFRYSDFAGLAVDFPFLPVLGAVAAGVDLDGESFGFDVVGQSTYCVGNPAGGLKVNADAVRHRKAGLPAHVLNAVDELARETFVDEIRRQCSVQRNGQAFSGFNDPAFDTLSSDGHILAADGYRLAVDFGRKCARLIEFDHFGG